MAGTVHKTAAVAAVADDKLEGRQPPTRHYGNETATRDGGDSGLTTMTVAAYGNCLEQRWWRMMMVLNKDSTQELAADGNG